MEKAFYSPYIKCVVAIGTFFLLSGLVNVTLAAEPTGRFGWVDHGTKIGGDDASCGPNMNRLELLVRERGTNASTTLSDPTAVLLLLIDRSTNSPVDSVAGAGPIVGSVCYDPDIHFLGLDIDGGASHYNYWGAHSIADPSLVPRGKEMQITVWLTPTSEATAEYQQVYPSPAVVTEASSSPEYVLDVNYVPSTYGATEVSVAEYYVVAYDEATDVYDFGDMVYGKESLSGGPGQKILPAVSLSDGWYGWSFYVRTNGTHDAGGGLTSEKVPSSSFGQLWEPFTLDTTPPTIVPGHTPIQPTQDETLTISATADDVLAGVKEISIYVNGTLEKTCSFAAANSGQCDTTVGPLAAGTYSYYVQAKDDFGNATTTAPTNVTVDAVTYPAPLTCTNPEFTVLGSAQADSSWFGGTFNELQSMQRVGDYLFAGGGDGPEVGEGLYVYDQSDPANLVQTYLYSTADSLSTWDNDVVDLDVVNNIAYLATYYGGLEIIDVSDPNSLVFRGNIDLGHETWDVEVINNYAFVAAEKGLVVIDVSDLNAPTEVTSLPLGSSVAQDLVIDGNHLYLVKRDGGFSVVDISDPSAPTEIARVTDGYNNSHWAYATEVKGNYLYVGDHFAEEIDVYNIYNPAAPVYVTSVAVPNAASSDSPRELYVEGDVLYVGAGNGGAYTFDITRPGAPTELYHLPRGELGATAKVWQVMPQSDGGDFTRLALVSEDPFPDTNPVLYTVDVVCDPDPDLSADTPTVSPNPVELGATVTFGTGNIENLGNADADPHDWSGFEIDINLDNIADYDTPAGSYNSVLAPGGIYSSTTDWVVPALNSAGTYRVRYIVDDGNVNEAVASSTWPNNTSPWTIFEVIEPPPTGSFTNGVGCEALVGESACDISLDWVTNNVWGSVQLQHDGDIISLGSGQTSETRGVEPDGDQLFELYDTGWGLLADVTLSATCEAGSTWNGSVCESTAAASCPSGEFYNTDPSLDTCVPEPELIVDPPEVWTRNDRQKELTYTITAPYTVTCTILDGAGSTKQIHDGTPPAPPEQDHTHTLRPLTFTQLVYISCEAPGMSAPVEEVVRVNVIGEIQEL